MSLVLKSFAVPQRGGLLVLAAGTFAAGLVAGVTIAPVSASRSGEPAVAATPPPFLRSGHPADVVRVIDGDTFEARVRIWPGMEITTRVRLRDIDAPEMHARCEDERVKAIASRDALAQLLAQGEVGISRIGQDKYGGRVDADVSTARTANVATVMLERGFARRYSGGRRQSWCG